MKSLVVVGLQWGDEGKGKIVDFLAKDFDIAVRFQGGSNAGHTVVIGDMIHKFRIMPTGAVRGKTVVIGNGVVVDPLVLWNEIDQLKKVGLEVKLLISDRAQVTTPYHILIDELQERSKDYQKIGTTKRGVGPTYTDKISRVGVRLCDLLQSEENSQWNLLLKSSQIQLEMLHGENISTISLDEFHSAAQRLIPFLGDSGSYLLDEMDSGKSVLFEGAQGTLLDIDHGTYPFVTSSNCISSNAATGTGIPFSRLDFVLGICKAYSTRVGTGPFPTELNDDAGQHMLDAGREYGTVTGRARRCGWLDIVALNYAIRINGCDSLALTKTDVLTGLNPLKICTSYEVDGCEVSTFPANAEDFTKISPIYEELEGWNKEDFEDTSALEELPEQLRKYISFIEQRTEIKIGIISMGPERSQTIVNPEVFASF